MKPDITTRRIRMVLMTCGMPREDICRKAKLTDEDLSELANGGAELMLVQKLCAATGASADFLLGFSNVMWRNKAWQSC